MKAIVAIRCINSSNKLEDMPDVWLFFEIVALLLKIHLGVP